MLGLDPNMPSRDVPDQAVGIFITRVTQAADALLECAKTELAASGDPLVRAGLVDDYQQLVMLYGSLCHVRDFINTPDPHPADATVDISGHQAEVTALETLYLQSPDAA